MNEGRKKQESNRFKIFTIYSFKSCDDEERDRPRTRNPNDMKEIMINVR